MQPLCGVLINKLTHMRHHFFAGLFCLFIIACNDEQKTVQPDDKKAIDNHSSHAATIKNNNYCDSVNNGLIAEDTLKGSPPKTAMATINGTHVHIEYSSPGVKGRIIWGGLVAYDKVWVTGAHKATHVQWSKAVEINGKKIPAGRYALFTIPGKEKWTLILNTRFDQHLADDYDAKEDVLRMEVKPQAHAMTQRLTYTVDKINERSAQIAVQWEKLQIGMVFNTL